ncbi:hypothetical protein GCM10011490_04220 [Pseudoclavibacter endophyticus]|uniref:Crossover junction endodeoxyribonuclease RuvC n=1 Tax=Pseudoclavibacter endophyticus TaxID=1778590 RepID=A0A6H9WGL0_9MICO|nr:crossover junction endodeoxyribonuclease RuvC [Pseudoclavibacter endophyticus]KAB1650062.1 crossover junction endodeoxyribonuclease RuvC [Pseudoclavibacter endophyticus]GGA57580.1 hypothetical protein GCM10011490_04220 [Pseudoclavibacter endophyticus]
MARILGIDPGLTRCGIGVIDVDARRRVSLVHVEVVRSSADAELGDRIRVIGEGIERALDAHAPDRVALERVFAQHNVSTVMATAQISGVVLYQAAKRRLPVALHTPSEVKAAVTGYGSADKPQVGVMVQRILGLAEQPRPADATDALALAICAAWKSPVAAAASEAAAERRGLLAARASGSETLTPAQRAWADAERRSRGR